MSIQDIQIDTLVKMYQDASAQHLQTARKIIEPHFAQIVETFYDELLLIPEAAPILRHSIVEKNLRSSLKNWLRDLFSPHGPNEIEAMIQRQKHIGRVHANIQVDLNLFTHGISILKREIFSLLFHQLASDDKLIAVFLTLSQVFDTLVTIVSEAYFSNEIIHETNELSIKMEGITQNTALDCERLRSLLLDWLRNTLTYLFQKQQIDLQNLPKLLYSNFGLWVIYKSDLISPGLNVSSTLKQQIGHIDAILHQAAEEKLNGNHTAFYEHVEKLNNAVTETSWFISSLVDQIMELDTGTDPLTRLFNRRYMDTILRRQTKISKKQGLPFSVLLIDIDHFKMVNDTYGHESGDMVLKQFAELLLTSVRTSDFIFRYGGEEFLLLLGNVQKEDAITIAEKIRQKCQSHAFQIHGDQVISRTCSIGVACFDGHPDFNRIVIRADTALYQAKENGRNRIEVAD